MAAEAVASDTWRDDGTLLAELTPIALHSADICRHQAAAAAAAATVLS